jgi:RNA ligase (TIGR02306 family)
MENENTQRVLARVASLASVAPIPGADRVVLGTVAGTVWDVVVPATYAVGERGVYIEIDAVLPDTLWAEGLVSGKHRTIRTMKIRGVLSQGLFVRGLVAEFPQLATLPEGTDVTALLGLTKRPEPVDTRAHGPRRNRSHERPSTRPDAVTYAQALGDDAPPKTDEPRVQASQYLLDAMVGLPYVLTLKVHGTSVTYGHSAEGLVVVSRNYIAPADSVYHAVAETYGLAATLAAAPHLVVQGEIYGPNLHMNLLEVPETRLAVFNVWDRRTRSYLDEHTARQWCAAQTPPLPCVPIVEQGDAFPATYTARTLLMMAEGTYPPPSTKPREGLVVRPIQPLFVNGERVSVKAINNAFLLAAH